MYLRRYWKSWWGRHGMCCRMGKLIMVGILTNGSLNVTWYRPKLHSFALSFCVFNLYILSLTMQGTCAIEGNTSLCVEDNECRTSAVMLCVLKKRKKKGPRRWLRGRDEKLGDGVATRRTRPQRVAEIQRLVPMCFWVHTYHFIAAYITPTAETSEKRAWSIPKH